MSNYPARYEHAIPIKIEATALFYSKSAAMTADEITQAIDRLASAIGNDVINVGQDTMTAELVAPIAGAIGVYDTEGRDYGLDYPVPLECEPIFCGVKKGVAEFIGGEILDAMAWFVSSALNDHGESYQIFSVREDEDVSAITKLKRIADGLLLLDAVIDCPRPIDRVLRSVLAAIAKAEGRADE
jgi:hypothetical protein